MRSCLCYSRQNLSDRKGSQADILPQFRRAAAMRREAAPQLASWRPAQSGQNPPSAGRWLYDRETAMVAAFL